MKEEGDSVSMAWNRVRGALKQSEAPVDKALPERLASRHITPPHPLRYCCCLGRIERGYKLSLSHSFFLTFSLFFSNNTRFKHSRTLTKRPNINLYEHTCTHIGRDTEHTVRFTFHLVISGNENQTQNFVGGGKGKGSNPIYARASRPYAMMWLINIQPFHVG